jgi:hypothetical protein
VATTISKIRVIRESLDSDMDLSDGVMQVRARSRTQAAEPAYHRGMSGLGLVVALVLAGCAGEHGPAADGTERGACYGNQTCNAGLTCLSDRCVRLPGADCEAVAEVLTSIELGNYAPKDQRAARVISLTAVCRAQNLTKDEGACILDKKTKDELAWCPKPLIVTPVAEDDKQAQAGLPASCTEYLRVLDQYARCPKLGADVSRQLKQTIDQMRRTWQQQLDPSKRLPKGVNEACVNGMTSIKAAMVSMGCP